MTDFKINVNADHLAGLFDNEDGLARLVTDVLNQILNLQATKALSATSAAKIVVITDPGTLYTHALERSHCASCRPYMEAPLFCKPSIVNGKKGEIAAVHSDFLCGGTPLFLMVSAG